MPTDIVGGFPPQASNGVVLTNASIGAAIRARRIGADQMLDDTATRAGITVPVLSRIERGERACHYAEMERITAALGTTAADVQELAATIRQSQDPKPGKDATRAGMQTANASSPASKAMQLDHP